MKELFRQYTESECVFDGYPWHWGHKSRDPVTLELIKPIKDIVRERAGYRCVRCMHPYRKGDERISERGEWSPCDEFCEHEGPFRYRGTGVVVMGETTVSKPDYRLAQWRILTVHHLDEDKGNCRWWNLASLCQRCHLRMQRAVVMDRPWHYEHSDWFKPYAAGFYAWKYLGEDLTSVETCARIEELLKLEHRFTQEAMPI